MRWHICLLPSGSHQCRCKSPSLQLSINRLDRVIALEGYNQDGQRLAQDLNVTMEPYTLALEEILDSAEIQEYLSQEEPVSITVSAESQEKSSQILTAAESCAAERQGVYCGIISQEDAADAAVAGVSMGRYRAYLQLRELDPAVTLEDIQGLSMREIRAWISALQVENNPSPGSSNTANGYGMGGGQGWQWGRRD